MQIGESPETVSSCVEYSKAYQGKDHSIVSEQHIVYNLIDNGGRRSGVDRRRFSYSGYIPERRSGKDRRNDDDRRCGTERRSGRERRSVEDRRMKDARVVVLEDYRSGKDRRESRDRRSGADRRDFMIL